MPGVHIGSNRGALRAQKSPESGPKVGKADKEKIDELPNLEKANLFYQAFPRLGSFP